MDKAAEGPLAAACAFEAPPADGLQINAAAPGNPPQSASAEFMMYTYKVEMCANPYNHDWAICPYAHAKDRARRRDPAVTHVAQPCPDRMQGRDCPRGEGCPYTHSVAEYWLHPLRFRTQYCKQGRGCGRRLCFFAHSPDELRSPSAATPPVERAAAAAAAASDASSSPMAAQQQQQSLLLLPGVDGGSLAAAASFPLLQAMAVDGAEALQLDGQPSLDLWQQAALAAAAPEAAAHEGGLAAAAAYARQRRMSFEERSALRMRLYLEQQRGLALQADAGAAAALALGAAAVPAAAAAAAPRGTRRGSAASYGGSSMLLPDLPETPTGQPLLGPLGLPTHSRRTSAASYCVPADAHEALLLAAAAAGQLPPGWTALAAGPGMPLRLRRASAASYGSASQQMLVDAGGLLGAAAAAPPGAGGLLPPRSRRASTASYGSGPAALMLAAQAPPVYAAPRQRRASCASTASALSFCAASAVMSDATGGGADGALDALAAAGGREPGRAAAAAAAVAGLAQPPIMFASMPEDAAPEDADLLGGPLFVWDPQPPAPAGALGGLQAADAAALAGVRHGFAAAQRFAPAATSLAM
ncbi:hypothetical protein Rsub_01632 [Raphidocelis subcapitata]|uniref:C3H1-type domain-containing protein n=1 Tax=Raphidocelis subcapitata TaxID=307507 RepID=A0A2V0NMJ7_9CHLO|nr:hypothetical protein Rsub_01632 [Raphidocelis subcapitata]|eukprot:GBF88731.1 hypothetical protein Rsub_01632 [Raphidocelis subcapitata]